MLNRCIEITQLVETREIQSQELETQVLHTLRQATSTDFIHKLYHAFALPMPTPRTTAEKLSTSRSNATKTRELKAEEGCNNTSAVEGIHFTLFSTSGHTSLQPALIILAHPEGLDAHNPMFEPIPNVSKIFHAKSAQDMMQYVKTMRQENAFTKQFLLDPLAIIDTADLWQNLKFERVVTTWPLLGKKLTIPSTESTQSQRVKSERAIEEEHETVATTPQHIKQSRKAAQEGHAIATTQQRAETNDKFDQRHTGSPATADISMMVLKLSLPTSTTKNPSTNQGYEVRMKRLLMQWHRNLRT